ncbi:hypothetical protein BDA96_10G119100 [Sorghum bicolor]|uniref:Uncharacterized protein n=3 Tax=Sorghum bicolor TaxID=4558 RepID=A0A1W0VS70_SORBI|nr:hypothetical protein BDA96_10G119100 [Sorghum bicolor]OQU76129.1 hypothetical protein SORBI_3010G097800 [Sorghum bicolor]
MASLPPSVTVIQMTSQTNDDRVPPAMPKGADDGSTTMAANRTAADKVMSSAANLAQLLPTGTVLAYQALSPSFTNTNHGTCLPANKWLTATLVAVLAAFSLLFSFTDSVVGRDSKLYYGVATPHGFNVFNFSGEEEEREWALGELQKLRLQPLDYVHAVVAAVVFLTVAFSDAGLQRCFFPNASNNTSELLKNLPLGMAFLSSFVYMIFPTKRKGIGYNDTTPGKKA